MPGGRPEGNEDWEQTLRREVLEEAFVVVTDACLLGFTVAVASKGRRGARCWSGRSGWRRARLDEWLPRFEIRYRQLVPFEQCISVVAGIWSFVASRVSRCAVSCLMPVRVPDNQTLQWTGPASSVLVK